MKTLFFKLTIILLGITLAAGAQKKIALQSGNTATFYSTIDSAIYNAVNGDIIYIPGGSYVIPTLIINKGVQVFGAGHYPDSTTATGQTVLTGDVRIVSGADNGSLQGCYILGSVFFGTNASDQTVHNFGLSRCNMAHLYLSFDANSSNASTNIYISENVILGSVNGGYCQNALFKKNIMNGRMYNHMASVFENNVFLLYATGNYYCNDYFLNNVTGSVFRNNIISHGDGASCGVAFFGNSNGNTFYNNVFRQPQSSYFPNGSNLQFNNYFGLTGTDVFNVFTGYSFNYTDNYHMPATCIAHNGGSDGTDPGIFGSVDPYKEGAVPSNPHIQSKNIAGSTDAQGNLNVDIKVAAQPK